MEIMIAAGTQNTIERALRAFLLTFCSVFDHLYELDFFCVLN